MTTREPGASDVFTHGLVVRPLSTALRARSPAASITDGFDVLVQLVMAATTTWPWSSSNRVPSARVTGTPRRARLPCLPAAPPGTGVGPAVASGSPTPVMPSDADGGSLAGKDWADAWSWLPLANCGSELTRALAN